ncbi:MAG: pyridoxal phosphate-dependent aminotransferase [Pseudomonadota bacterium]
MSLSVSDRLTRVKPSATGAVLARATELKQQGVDIVSLGAGEPDFDTPLHIQEAAIEAIRRGETRYTPIDGTRELKVAIRRKFARDNQLDYAPEQILVSSGAKQSLFNLCIALLGPGDEVIVPAPHWVSYPDMARLADATPVVVTTELEEGFKLSPAALRAALSERTRLLILNSPSNPTGTSYSGAELAALGEVLADYPDVVVAADDIYEHIHWAEHPFASFAEACPALYDRTVTVNGVSKAYAMTGWRIGYAAGPEWLIKAMKTVQSQSTSNPCSVSQAAAVAALDGDQAVVTEMTRHYKQRHDALIDRLNDIPGFECRPGDGAFYAFPRVTGAVRRLGLASDLELAERFITAANVALVPGTAFGAPDHLRLSFALSLDALEVALDRLKSVMMA